MPLDLSVVRPRSFCPQCEHQIAWHENIPVVSYLLLRGKCGHCGAGISKRYPVVELLTGGLFFLSIYVFGLTAIGLKMCVCCPINVALIFTDLEERILPDDFTLGGMLAGIAFAFFVPMPSSLLQLLVPP